MNELTPDPIDYLLRRKFGFPTVDDPGLAYPSTEALVSKLGEAQRQAYDTCKAALEIKKPEEIRALFEAERAKYRPQEKTNVDPQEQRRFFNLPAAAADFKHWSKAAHWTLDEAVALSFGKAPEVVNWKSVEPYEDVSPFAKRYRQVRDLALRAAQWQQLFDPMLPGIFLAWAERADIAVPPELVAAVKARGVQVADWKTLYDQLLARHKELAKLNSATIEQQRLTIAELNELSSSLANEIAAVRAAAAADSPKGREIGTRERDSLLKLVIGMAVGGYRYDPAQKRSDKLPEIVSDLERAGVPLDADTVRKWLKQAADLLPPKQTE